MNPWYQMLMAIGLSAAGAVLALRWRRGWWLLFVLGLGTVAVSWAFANHIPRRWHGFSYSLALPWVALPLLRFPGVSRLARVGLMITTAGVVFAGGWMEFLGPAMARAELAKLTTTIDDSGVCKQNTSYTCGPAAAVSALRRLGFPAEEGEMALLACTGPRTGTDPTDLADAIRHRFGPTGVRVDEHPLDTLDDLRHAGLALTVIKWDESVDHWVAVLEINEHGVRYADPALGLRTKPCADFAAIWEHETIRLWKE